MSHDSATVLAADVTDCESRARDLGLPTTASLLRDARRSLDSAVARSSSGNVRAKAKACFEATHRHCAEAMRVLEGMAAK